MCRIDEDQWEVITIGFWMLFVYYLEQKFLFQHYQKWYSFAISQIPRVREVHYLEIKLSCWNILKLIVNLCHIDTDNRRFKEKIEDLSYITSIRESCTFKIPQICFRLHCYFDMSCLPVIKLLTHLFLEDWKLILTWWNQDIDKLYQIEY